MVNFESRRDGTEFRVICVSVSPLPGLGFLIHPYPGLTRWAKFVPPCGLPPSLISVTAALIRSIHYPLVTNHFLQLRLHRVALARHLQFGEDSKRPLQLLLLGFPFALRPRRTSDSPQPEGRHKRSPGRESWECSLVNFESRRDGTESHFIRVWCRLCRGSRS